MKAVLRGRITALNVYIETFEESQISNLIMYIKNLEKQEQYPSSGGEKLDRKIRIKINQDQDWNS